MYYVLAGLKPQTSVSGRSKHRSQKASGTDNPCPAGSVGTNAGTTSGEGWTALDVHIRGRAGNTEYQHLEAASYCHFSRSSAARLG
jgi:hypothetical protein